MRKPETQRIVQTKIWLKLAEPLCKKQLDNKLTCVSHKKRLPLSDKEGGSLFFYRKSVGYIVRPIRVMLVEIVQ